MHVDHYLKNYSISKSGVVKNKSGKVIKQQIDRDGYKRVTLYKHNKQKTFLVHRLVAHLYVFKNRHKPQVNHIDGDKSNNHCDNLEWCTSLENIRHAYRIGLMDNHVGENHPRSKLKESDVDEIREMIESGKSQRYIADIYNVSHNTIGKINRGEMWL